MQRRPKHVLAYLLCDLCSATPSVRTLWTLQGSDSPSISWLLGLCFFLVGLPLLRYLTQCGLTSVLSHGKVKAVPLSPSFEGGSSLWRIVSCANTLRCLTWLRQPQSTSGYRCWSFSTLYQSSLISHPITIVSVVIHFLVVYYDNIWSWLQKAIFHTKIIKVRYVWKVGILM